ncbi:MAG: hypothetical protein RBU29_17470, partial [bacterium]|nr:hypothetical protein [bacterium]
MRSSLALFSLLWAGLLATIFLFTHGGALLVLSLHLRTLLCGLLPVLVFYPLAWQTIRWLDKSRTLPGDEALPYALFTALAYASAAGFLLLTVGLGTPLMLLLVCGLGLIGSLRWWKNALSAKEFQSVLGSYRGGTAVERILFLLAGGMVLCAA